MLKRLNRIVGQFKSTQQYLLQLAQGDHNAALEALDMLKERLCHQNGTLCGMNLTGARLNGATLATSYLEAIIFQRANLIEAYFYAAKLQRADFSHANLTDANLRAAHLHHANFAHSHLQNTNFARAILIGADFRHARMYRANLWNANLCDVNFTGADMRGVNLAYATFNENTLLPDGSPWSPDSPWQSFLAE